jgi:predicted HicB family RNase H-like nuclease
MNTETMSYKGYTASIDYSEEESCLVGEVVGIEDGILFRGSTRSGIYETFKEMIDEYLADCEKEGIEPNKPPMEVMVPFPPELYALAYGKAESTGATVNQFMHAAVRQSMSLTSF